MPIFRPSNLNKRLVGIQTQSPGNGGQIGPTKTPYCYTGKPTSIQLGCCDFGAGACGGIFKTNESACGVRENCNIPYSYCGFYICCGPSTQKWFVAPDTTEVCRTWHCRACTLDDAQAATGLSDWFIPTCDQLYNPGWVCRTYWDSYKSTGDTTYWSDTERNASHANTVGYENGSADTGGFYGNPKNCNRHQRAFRCNPT